MTHANSFLVGALLAILLGACASSPQKPAPSNVVATTTAQNSEERIAEAAKRAKELSYHIETRHGDQFYCRTVAPIGSLLTEKECLTADTMAQSARMEDENQAARRQGQVCQGGSCAVN